MRSLVRLIITLIVLAALVYAAAIALALYVKPTQEQKVIEIPEHKINTK